MGVNAPNEQFFRNLKLNRYRDSATKTLLRLGSKSRTTSWVTTIKIVPHQNKGGMSMMRQKGNTI